MLIKGDDEMIPTQLDKQFKGAINNKNRKKYIKKETKEERLERIGKQLGIQKHGKGKRKKRNKKKGGSK